MGSSSIYFSKDPSQLPSTKHTKVVINSYTYINTCLCAHAIHIYKICMNNNLYFIMIENYVKISVTYYKYTHAQPRIVLDTKPACTILPQPFRVNLITITYYAPRTHALYSVTAQLHKNHALDRNQ
jgi:hypothetical protein